MSFQALQETELNRYIQCSPVTTSIAVCSGHIPLNMYLHKFKLVESTQCLACRHPKETAQNILLECPAYAHERRILKPRRGKPEKKFAVLLCSKETAEVLTRYIHTIGRFNGKQWQEMH